MSKIIKLKNTAAYYYERALDKSDKDDFIGCLELLRRAEPLTDRTGSDESLAIRLEIADTLGMMGAYEESNRAYYRLTAYDYCLDDVYYGLIKNYALMDMTEQAVHYLNYALDTGIFSPDDGFEPIDFELLQKPAGENLRLLKPDDNLHTVRIAKQLLGASDTGFARQILEGVPESSEQYTEAMNYLALIEVSDGHYDEGLRLCGELLERNPADIYALTTRVLAHGMSGNKKAAAVAAAELDGAGVDTWSDTAKVALCFCQTGDNALAFKYLEKCLRFMPYDRGMLLLYALCAVNTGRFQKARDTAVTLQLIYPDEPAVRYYARAIGDAIRAERAAEGEPPIVRFELTPDLPAEQCERYGGILESAFLAAGKYPAVFLQLAESDFELGEAARWGLYSGIYTLQAKLGKILARAASGFSVIREILIDPDYPPIPKKEIFAEVLRAGKHRILQTVVNHEIRWYRPSIPKEVKNKALIGAYWQVYAALAFIDQDFDRKLNGWYKKLGEVFRSAGSGAGIGESAAAALLAYKSRVNKIFSSKQAVCEVFGCGEEEFARYLKKTDDYFSAARVRGHAKAPKGENRH